MSAIKRLYCDTFIKKETVSAKLEQERLLKEKAYKYAADMEDRANKLESTLYAYIQELAERDREIHVLKERYISSIDVGWHND